MSAERDSTTVVAFAINPLTVGASLEPLQRWLHVRCDDGDLRSDLCNIPGRGDTRRTIGRLRLLLMKDERIEHRRTHRVALHRSIPRFALANRFCFGR